VISNSFAFTFQFAKRFNWLTLRYGIKESTGGVGADIEGQWWNHDLKFSADVYDATWDTYPRVKLTAAYELFRHLYILGGIDDALNKPQNLAVINGDSPVPTELDTLRFGRDYFLGAMLRFNDEDLAALLTVGGSAIANAAK